MMTSIARAPALAGALAGLALSTSGCDNEPAASNDTGSVAWGDVGNKPQGLDDGDDDTLASISGCSAENVVVYDGATEAWKCASSRLANGSVSTPKLAQDAVNSSKIGDGAIQAEDIADGAVGLGELSTGVESAFLQRDEDGDVPVSDALTVESGGSIQYANPQVRHRAIFPMDFRGTDEAIWALNGGGANGGGVNTKPAAALRSIHRREVRLSRAAISAPLHVPDGAKLNSVGCYYYDYTPHGQLTFELHRRYPVQSADPALPFPSFTSERCGEEPAGDTDFGDRSFIKIANGCAGDGSKDVVGNSAFADGNYNTYVLRVIDKRAQSGTDGNALGVYACSVKFQVKNPLP